MARSTITTRRVAPRQFYNSINFGGQNSGAYVEFPFLFDPSATDFTAALFFQVNNYTTGLSPIQSMALLSQLDGAGTGRSWIGIRNTSCAIEDSFSGSSTNFTSTIINGLGWHHVIITFDAATSTRRFYYNGVLIDTKVITVESATGAMRIGSNKSSIRNIVGNITELRIWNRRFSDTEAADYYYDNSFSRSGLQLEALLTEGSGSTVADTSGNGNNGTITTATWSTNLPPFQQRSALSTARTAITTARTAIT